MLIDYWLDKPFQAICVNSIQVCFCYKCFVFFSHLHECILRECLNTTRKSHRVHMIIANPQIVVSQFCVIQQCWILKLKWVFTDLTLLFPVAVYFRRNSLTDGSWLTIFMVAAVADLTQSGDCGGFGRCKRPPAADGSDFVLNHSCRPGVKWCKLQIEVRIFCQILG